MAAPEPIYTPENCKLAYQLLWGLGVFWRAAPGTDDWLADLKPATEQDHVRILNHRFEQPDFSHFLTSTRPHVAPLQVPRSVKGRLQHLLRDRLPKPFQRNYSLRSIGSTRREKLEQYLEAQLGHHPMADERVQRRLARYQIVQRQVDLAAPRHTSHARYWHNLHVVMVNDGRWMEIRDEVLHSLRDGALRASRSKGHLLSRAAILPDHVHLTLGCRLQESPLAVALSYMNNLAFACGMKPVFTFSCFVGTLGEYDLGAVR